MNGLACRPLNVGPANRIRGNEMRCLDLSGVWVWLDGRAQSRRVVLADSEAVVGAANPGVVMVLPGGGWNKSSRVLCQGPGKVPRPGVHNIYGPLEQTGMHICKLQRCIFVL